MPLLQYVHALPTALFFHTSRWKKDPRSQGIQFVLHMHKTQQLKHCPPKTGFLFRISPFQRNSRLIYNQVSYSGYRKVATSSMFQLVLPAKGNSVGGITILHCWLMHFLHKRAKYSNTTYTSEKCYQILCHNFWTN